MKLVIENLSKTYPNGTHAIKNLSLSISQGMFGLLGANGAGKSTLMRTIATLQMPDTGSIFLNELDLLKNHHSVRKTLGYLPQEFGVYPRVSAFRLLDHFAQLKGMPRKRERRELVDNLLHRVNLYSHRKKAVAKYSGGMRQRFGIAQALIGNPKLLIVDEPTAGLDPGERNRFYNLLAEISDETIVILSTHIVQDVKELCTKMAILNQGTLVYAGAPEKAQEKLAGKIWQKKISRDELPQYRERLQVLTSKMLAGMPQIRVLSDTDPGADFEQVEPDLEDVFFVALETQTAADSEVQNV